jgi:hypothetical protein
MFPCQDTPGIKATYSAKVKSILPVLMSGLRVSPPSEETLEPGKEVQYVYDQVTTVQCRFVQPVLTPWKACRHPIVPHRYRVRRTRLQGFRPAAGQELEDGMLGRGTSAALVSKTGGRFS